MKLRRRAASMFNGTVLHFSLSSFSFRIYFHNGSSARKSAKFPSRHAIPFPLLRPSAQKGHFRERGDFSLVDWEKEGRRETSEA